MRRDTTYRRLALLAALFVGLGTPAASAKDSDEKVPTGGKCKFSIPKQTFRLEPVLKRGIPIRISCDGPAGVIAMMSWEFGSPQRNQWNLNHPGGIPGISTGPRIRLWEPRTVIFRERFTPEAARFVRRYARTRISLSFGIERGDKPNVFRRAGHRWIVLVRG